MTGSFELALQPLKVTYFHKCSLSYVLFIFAVFQEIIGMTALTTLFADSPRMKDS